jgi:predicted nucleic acid-binding protein
MAADPVFLDTNVLVAASVAEHPSHTTAAALIAKIVGGKQVHDANIVATMRAKNVVRLATLNAPDFERYEDEVSIEALVT